MAMKVESCSRQRNEKINFTFSFSSKDNPARLLRFDWHSHLYSRGPKRAVTTHTPPRCGLAIKIAYYSLTRTSKGKNLGQARLSYTQAIYSVIKPRRWLIHSSIFLFFHFLNKSRLRSLKCVTEATGAIKLTCVEIRFIASKIRLNETEGTRQGKILPNNFRSDLIMCLVKCTRFCWRFSWFDFGCSLRFGWCGFGFTGFRLFVCQFNAECVGAMQKKPTFTAIVTVGATSSVAAAAPQPPATRPFAIPMPTVYYDGGTGWIGTLQHAA